MSVRFVRIHPDARPPIYGTSRSAAIDLYACVPAVIPPHARVTVRTGLCVALPDGTFGSIRCRSSVAKRGLSVEAGVIDADYRGEVMVMLHNHTDTPYDIAAGPSAPAIAQLIVQPYVHAALEEVSSLDATARGAGGFGSTDRHA